jgi:hypothetical protein
MLPYLQHPSLPLPVLLDGIKPSDLPVATEALLELARSYALEGMEREIQLFQGHEREKREILSRQVVQEVVPVLEVGEIVDELMSET